MSSGRPNQRTLELLADPEIRDRAEDAARELQEAARERQGDHPYAGEARRWDRQALSRATP
jgi:hypothetical protein